MPYDTIITEETRLREYLDDLRQRGVKKLALDMEGDQGMFHYKYAVSILQCFDGENAAVIDVLKMGSNDTLREFLTCQDIIKVMFACGNDIFMAQTVIGCTITPINDISVAQKLLGQPINLANYLNIEKEEKDSFQRANWLLRPIKPALLEYAINDVLKLLEIEGSMVEQLVEKGLYDEYIRASRAASDKKHVSNPHLLFETKFPGYARMPFDKRQRAAALWIFRELLGERFDCPVGYLLPKKSLSQVLHSDKELPYAIEAELNRHRKPQKKLSLGLIKELLDTATRSPHIPDKPAAIKRRRVYTKPQETREATSAGGGC
jgi:ribonuclease D